MAENTVEDRLAALEEAVAKLTRRLLPGEKLPPEKDWRSTIGMFAGDPIMAEIIEEGRKIREEDRRIARENDHS
ncbi:hypothetical protein [Aeoliella sp. SH292]|jgi:hypothetical protein|uniref:hypothetical protein n=1 Tax=Aeoliella sp. SH292 TaxID=3454464 RepID=UPI003F9BFDE7